MIKREDIKAAIKINTCIHNMHVTMALDSIMPVIEAEQAKYTALVDAAVAFLKLTDAHKDPSTTYYHVLRTALEPFLPPPLLSEKLNKLAECTFYDDSTFRKDLRQLADEARKLEK